MSKKILEIIDNNIVGANRWFVNHKEITILNTQKEAARFLIRAIKSKEGSLRKLLGDAMLNLLEQGYLEDVKTSENEADLRDIINEMSNKIPDHKVNLSNNSWQLHKPTKLNSTENKDNAALNELTGSVNDIAACLIELADSGVELNKPLHEKLINFSKRIDLAKSMTFDEEANKLFEEEGKLLIAKYAVGNEPDILSVINVEDEENWVLCLWWILSKHNSSRCILNEDNNPVIIGKEAKVNIVLSQIAFYKKEILNHAIEFANLEKKADTIVLHNVVKNSDEIIRIKQQIEIDFKKNYNDHLFGTVKGLHDSMKKKQGGVSGINIPYPCLGFTIFSCDGRNLESLSYANGLDDGEGLAQEVVSQNPN